MKKRYVLGEGSKPTVYEDAGDEAHESAKWKGFDVKLKISKNPTHRLVLELIEKARRKR